MIGFGVKIIRHGAPGAGGVVDKNSTFIRLAIVQGAVVKATAWLH